MTGSSLPVYKGKLEVKRDNRPIRTPAQQAAVDAYLKKYTEVAFDARINSEDKFLLCKLRSEIVLAGMLFTNFLRGSRPAKLRRKRKGNERRQKE